MKYKVLFQSCPMWKPGERDVDAAARRANHEDAEAKDRYPNDYTGRVISVIPDQKAFSPADLADPCRRVVGMDLSKEGLAALRTRTHKIGNGFRLEEATFDDRWGGIANVLRANFDDPEVVEREFLDTRDANDVDTWRFTEISALAIQMLPKVEVHSGAELYEVGPTKTYSTIQSALDQLWTDQGSATFTATQIIRVFADTYDEAAIPNDAFEPDDTNGFLLVIEGDPTDSRDNIIIAPTVDVVGIGIDCRSCVVRHLTVTTAVATIGIFCWVSNVWAEVTDCVVTLTASAASTGIFMLFQGYVADCDVSVQSQTVNTRGIYSFGATGILTIKRCTVTGNGGSAVGIKGQSGHIVVESCTVSDFMVGFGDTGSRSPHLIRNCIVYNCDVGVWQTIEDHSILDIVNTIFHTCTEVFTIEDAWPEWSATDVIGSFVRPLNCCFYNYTTFAGQAGLAGTKTFAEFIALDRVEAEGNLDVTDPLFTNPGTGDFSLQTGSPCIKTGHGVGLVLDYLGVAFDPNNPDIGAWSSGVSLGIPDTPTITAIVNDGDGTSATASVLTETGSKVFLLSRRINSVEAWTIRGSRSESGDIVATGYANNAAYESIAISTFGDLVTEDPSLPSIPVNVYITDTAGFFAVIRQALYDWVSGELAIPTIWYRPNAPQPAKAYAAINMGPTQSPRWDYHSPPDDVDGISTLRGDREFGVEIQIHGRRLPNNENEALTFAEQLTTSLQKGSIVALFSAANFAFVDRVALTDLSAIGGTEFEARVSLELLFRMAHEDTDTVGVIATADPVGATYE